MRCVLGIDVGGTNIRAGLYEPQRRVLHCLRAIGTEAEQGGIHALTRVADLARTVIEAGKAQGLSTRRVGIGIPELVAPDGRIASASTLPWRLASVRSRLRQFGAVTVIPDVVAAALAEARLGAGRGRSVFLYLSVGTGISSTLVIDGRPFRGAHGHALCFASGRTAAAGESLEGRASGPALLARARARGVTVPDTPALLAAAGAAAGAARELVDAAATELALHVAILANALDPGLIVLGGGLGCAPGRFAATFRASLPQYTWGTHARRLQVRRAQLGARAGVIGAGLGAVESVQSG